MTSRRRWPYGRVAATLVVAASLGAACGKVTTSDSAGSTHPDGDAGPDGATGGAPGAGGSVASGGAAGSAAGPAGAGPVGGSPPGIGGAYVPDGSVCEDLTRTLPTSCVPPLCDCAGLADCDLKCWIDVACIRQRCAGTADPNCASACGNPGGRSRYAVAKCVTLTPECGGTGSCGDGVVTLPETCDGKDFLGQTCQDYGFKRGELACTSSCDVDPLGCTSCGDGLVDPGEECEGADVKGIGCTNLGFVGGTLGCDDKCHYDTSKCTSCGNGRLDKGEDCDGDLLRAGITCRGYGFSGGTPSCKDCSVDTKSCAVCGNGVIEPGETCDGAALGGAVCQTFGLEVGTLACDPKECRWDVSGCPNTMPRCGDGIAERGEQCDGDLAGLDCKAFGYDKGTLACNQATCRFDDTGCAREPHDTCQECREVYCKASLDACLADSRCLDGLHCTENCVQPDLEQGRLQACINDCFADDFAPGGPGNRPQAIALVLQLWGCTSSNCVDSCVTPLSSP